MITKQDIQFSISQCERQIATMQAKLAENFCHHYAWVGEDLFMENYKMEWMKAMIADHDANTNKMWEDVVQYHIQRHTDHTKRSYNVRENSTGTLHREVSTWKFIAHMQLLEMLTK